MLIKLVITITFLLTALTARLSIYSVLIIT